MGTTDPSQIPVVILAGGRGARFDHESQVVPKPMIEVDRIPVLQHIINAFMAQGFHEFIVLTGYLGERIDGYFSRVGHLISPWTYRSWNPGIGRRLTEFTVKTVNTGLDSHTGLRIWNARDVIGDRRFVLTYGDGLSNVQMADVLSVHEMDTIADHPSNSRPHITLTAVNPPGRFGVLRFNGAFDRHVRSFEEKSSRDWINGGFMVCEPELIWDGLSTGMELEGELLPKLASEWRLRAHRHTGYWRCMDTRRDREQIEEDVRSHGHHPWMR